MNLSTEVQGDNIDLQPSQLLGTCPLDHGVATDTNLFPWFNERKGAVASHTPTEVMFSVRYLRTSQVESALLNE